MLKSHNLRVVIFHKMLLYSIRIDDETQKFHIFILSYFQSHIQFCREGKTPRLLSVVDDFIIS